MITSMKDKIQSFIDKRRFTHTVPTTWPVFTLNSDKCTSCEICVSRCPYNAASVDKENKTPAYINPVLCKGCGTCAATCPVGAIGVKHYDFDQIGAMIDSYLLEKIKNGGTT